jgi:arginyl-tRNA synthetase
MENILKEKIKEAVRKLYGVDIPDELAAVGETRKDFKGDFTLVVFPLLKYSKNTPENTAAAIGEYLKSNVEAVDGFNVLKGFLNVAVSGKFWTGCFSGMACAGIEERLADKSPHTVMIEYSSPNTNKPLHLGHVRNNLLGFSLSRILSSCGYRVIKTNIVNDRGIHICKSMLAWQKFGNGETPESSGIKGDHLVGKYYVMFEQNLKKEISALAGSGIVGAEARDMAPLMKEAREMLLRWEAGDKEVVDLWKMMNSWVYAGFDETYRKLGVDFDTVYYESETYMLGKQIVLDALDRKILYQKEDSSIWADMTPEGLDQKLLLRSDGTAVYMTQDLGTAVDRYNTHKFDRHLYVVGNEQNYHFEVLKALLGKMGYEWSSGLVHFSYGMIELPDGKMKSREGTVVDADDLIEEMIATAREMSLELGKLSGFSEDEKEDIFRRIGLGALKYFILKVDPRKNMTFNPAESIDFNGNTAPFIQYTCARIKSVLRKAAQQGITENTRLLPDATTDDKEVVLIKMLRRYPETVKMAAASYSPALIANYCYELAKEFNQFYHDFPILGEDDPLKRNFRMSLARVTSETLGSGMWMLGIEIPERM